MTDRRTPAGGLAWRNGVSSLVILESEDDVSAGTTAIANSSTYRLHSLLCFVVHVLVSITVT